MPSLADLLQESDGRRFAGRNRELSALEELLEDGSDLRLVFLHGAGGSGKSSLCGELARRAARRGFLTRIIDGRRLDPAPATLERTLGDLDRDRPTLIVIDTYERVRSLDGHLRQHLLPGLPDKFRIVVAGRQPPDPAWSREGWDAITMELALGPLSEPEALEMIRKRGIEDEELARALVSWGRGEPLPIALGCEAALRDPGFSPGDLDDDDHLADRLIRRICDGELDGRGGDVLLVAAVARLVDGPMLEELTGVPDGTEAAGWLEGLSFSERIGGRLTLNERLRQAMRTRARVHDPLGVDHIRGRLADHLMRRALAGEPELVAEIAALIENPVLKFGFDGGEVHRADRLREGDIEAIERRVANGGRLPDWWPGVVRWLVEAPGSVILARDDRGVVAGFAIAVTPATAPGWASEDIVVGRWLADARKQSPEGSAVIWRDTFDFTARPAAPAVYSPNGSGNTGTPGREAVRTGSSEVVALLNAAVTVSCGLDNPRWFYGPVSTDDERATALSEAMGAVHLAELDVTDGSRRIQCHRFDHGPGGIIATVHAMVMAELRVGSLNGRAVTAFPTPDVARQILREYHRPERLALSPLAEGHTLTDRADSLRRRVQLALESAFGDSTRDQLLRQALQRGYLDPDANHTRAALDLHLSRSTYFRRLREATARLAAAKLER